MKKILLSIAFCSVCIWTGLQAQDTVTNAFDDLKQKGTVSEQNSEMKKVASTEALTKLLDEQPTAGFFCFTEDRMHNICLPDAIPSRWTTRSVDSRTHFEGSCQPGEFYTWQIGIFSPYKNMDNITMTFSDLRNAKGDRIKASALHCFNLEGIGTDGLPFKKKVDVSKGSVQALWIGTDVPTTANGLYKGTVRLFSTSTQPVVLSYELTVSGDKIENQGDNEGWRKTRLRWLNSSIGCEETPTIPYKSLEIEKQTISWLGGSVNLAKSGLPATIQTYYDQSNQLSQEKNPILAKEMTFIVETENGQEILRPSSFRITKQNKVSIEWTASQKNKNIEVNCMGKWGFDGLAEYSIRVKSLQDIHIKDIRLEVPYTGYAAKYMMGLGHKGGLRPDSAIHWQWDTRKHQDKIWMGNVNAGLNFCFKDENYKRPLVNIYYELGKLNLPTSWGNNQKGGVRITPENENVYMNAYSGERTMKSGDELYYNFSMLVTPVKPLDFKKHSQARFYHSNSDISKNYIPEAVKGGANMINVHHKKDIYPFINYPYYDESVSDLKNFIAKAHNQNLDVRLYYTTRELTVKIPEIWALRSLGSEIIHDGPGENARTLIHPNGPNEWLNKNLKTHFIPAWYNAFKEGKYAGDMDISVITTPDSRWNNYYLQGLDWMIKNLGLDGVYIDDSALDHQTLQRARRILDTDGKRRLIDIHSWNHMNEWAGYANSIQLYLELLPYVDQTWLGEGFEADNTADFWLVEMSGIPFGLMSETLDAQNPFRGMIYGMLPRLPWSGNPTALWQLWDDFDMQNANIRGFWDKQCPVITNNSTLRTTVYTHGDKAMVVIANWTDMPQTSKITIDEKLLGFSPTSYILPEIRHMQWGNTLKKLDKCEIMGRGGMIILLQK